MAKQKKSAPSGKGTTGAGRGNAPAGRPAVRRGATPAEPARDTRDAQVPKRAAGGVPPPEAFDHVKRLPPPNLSGQRAPQQQAVGAEGKGGKKRRGKAVPMPQDPVAASRAATGGKRPPRAVNPARKRRRRRLAAAVACIALIGGGVWLCFNMLFKIEQFELQGESRYNVEQIAAAFGHDVGDNMYGYVKSSAEDRIMRQLPYIETITVRRRLPGTVIFQVTPAEEAYTLEYGGVFAVLSPARKVLRLTAERPAGLVELFGLEHLRLETGQPLALAAEGSDPLALLAAQLDTAGISNPAQEPESEPDTGNTDGDDTSDVSDSDTPVSDDAVPATAGDGLAGEDDDSRPGSDAGQSAEQGQATSDAGMTEKERATAAYQKAEERLQTLNTLLAALQTAGFDRVDWVDVRDVLDLKFRWDNRVTVRLGPKGGMDSKLQAALVLLTDTTQQGLIAEGDRGVLDMGLYLSTGRSYFMAE